MLKNKLNIKKKLDSIIQKSEVNVNRGFIPDHN